MVPLLIHEKGLPGGKKKKSSREMVLDPIIWGKMEE